MFRRVSQSLLGASLVLMAALTSPGVAKGDDENLQSWSHKINRANQRFEVLSQFNNEAVLDEETQLVWERQGSKPFSLPWTNANIYCAQRATGGRGGWRLPTIAELTSLIDPAITAPFPQLRLPQGHPFVGLSNTDVYWSATATPGEEGFALGLVLTFSPATDVPISASDVNVTQEHSAWCVRGR